MIGTVGACFLSYFVGSIPSGLILGKVIWGIDLREHGSKNIGATNAWRTLGKKAGIIIFLCDFLKGALGVLFGSYFGGMPLALVLGGIFSIIGHSCSFFLRFRGGKGVATGLGVIAMLMPIPTLIVFGIWFIVVKSTGYVSLGSIIAASLVPILAVFFSTPFEVVVFGIVAAVFIIVRHRENIIRLMNGTESKIKAASK